MTTINPVTELTREGDVSVVTLNSPPVNALSAAVRDGLFEGFKAAIDDPDSKAIVLICDGRTFIAGADISEFGGQMKGASLFDVQDMMENSPKPVIAAIHGTALGGGLEVALVRALSRGGAEREMRLAGSESRSAPRRRRHAAPAAHRRARKKRLRW